jgi:hypothetical protein
MQRAGESHGRAMSAVRGACAVAECDEEAIGVKGAAKLVPGIGVSELSG